MGSRFATQNCIFFGPTRFLEYCPAWGAASIEIRKVLGSRGACIYSERVTWLRGSRFNQQLPQALAPQQVLTTSNEWATEILHDAPRLQFIIGWASSIPGRFLEGEEGLVCRASISIYEELISDD